MFERIKSFYTREIIIKYGGLLLILIFAFIGFQYVLGAEKEATKEFGLKREEIMTEYIYVIIGFSPEQIKGDNSSQFCDRYSEFTAYFDKDTRSMTNTELKDAIGLFDDCHFGATSARYSLVNNLSSSISELVGINEKIKNKDLAILTTGLVENWRKVQKLESEKTDIIKQQVDNEKLYWVAQLGYNNRIDSFSQRQDSFQLLNDETYSQNKRVKEIDSEVKELKTEEGDLWNIFKVKTGYIESSDKKSK